MCLAGVPNLIIGFVIVITAPMNDEDDKINPWTARYFVILNIKYMQIIGLISVVIFQDVL